MDDPQLLVDAKEKIRQSIDTILVPQGAEYEAVCRGLRGKVPHLPTVRAIPMAYRPLKAHLANWLASDDFQQCPASGVLLLGLAGSLSPKYSVGELVIYQKCLKINTSGCPEGVYSSDMSLGSRVNKVMGSDLSSVTAINSDHFIGSIEDKTRLAQQYQADVVDMESAAAFSALEQAKIPIVVIRAISDDIGQNMPDLSGAINSKGELAFLPLGLKMLAHPLAALRLMQGSQKGLAALGKLVNKLF